MKIGIISDIHEDISSLKEAIQVIEKLDCREILCLGDITGYDKVHYKKINSPHASECISVIKANCNYVVPGNHDLYSIRKLPAFCDSFKFPLDWYQLTVEERERISENKVWLYKNECISSELTQNEKEYLNSLPEYFILEFNNRKLFFSHSVYPDLTGSLIHRPHDTWDLRNHFIWLKDHYCLTGFSGHMHPPGIMRTNYNHIKFLSFGCYKIENDYAQYFCPCIAGNSGKNGFLILNSDDMTLEAVKLKIKNKKWFFLYERLYKKNKP